MGKRLTFEEKFDKWKEEVKTDFLNLFLHHYTNFKEIEQGLIKEKREQWEKEKK